MPYILDSDWIINALAERPEAVDTLDRLAPEGISQFLHPYRVLDLNDPIMERFAEVRHLLRRRGQMIPDLDILLGATALHYDLTMLTSNVRHPGRIPGIKLYQQP